MIKAEDYKGGYLEEYDLLVVGGGIAGVSCAIQAARLGLRVGLVQNRPVLGGNSSSEIRVPVGGADEGGGRRYARETGVLEEIRLEDRARNHSPHWTADINSIWDLVLLEWVKKERTLDLYLNTHCRTAIMRGSRIEGMICHQQSSEREIALRATLFCDCSGDGQLAFDAGAEFRMGREARAEFNESLAPEQADSYTLGNSLLFKVVDVGRPVPFTPPAWARDFPTDDELPHRHHGHFRGGEWWIEFGGTLDTIKDAEAIREELVRCQLGVWDHIKNHGDHGAANLAIEWMGTVPGKRESRRFVGDYLLNEHDVRNARFFEDAVAFGGWWIDHHPPKGIFEPGPPATMIPLQKLYTIPLRSLYSKNIENLLFAGRNASVTHAAFGTTRLMATGGVMGLACGVAAAIAVREKCSPREAGRKHIREIQQLLLRHDAFIPGVRNEDPADLALGAEVRASSHAALKVELAERLEQAPALAQLIPVEPGFDKVELLLGSSLQTEIEVAAELHRVEGLEDHPDGKPQQRATAKLPPTQKCWVEFPLEVNERGLYWIVLRPPEGVGWWRAEAAPPGTQRADCRERWEHQWRRGTLCFRTTPALRPFGPANVNNGFARPWNWPNIWISEPGLPQWIELRLPEEKTLGTVVLTFDTNFAGSLHHTLPNETVSDADVLAEAAGVWKRVAEIRGNYQRRVVLDIEPVKTRVVRVVVLAARGVAEARIYEIRLYEPGRFHEARA